MTLTEKITLYIETALELESDRDFAVQIFELLSHPFATSARRAQIFAVNGVRRRIIRATARGFGPLRGFKVARSIIRANVSIAQVRSAIVGQKTGENRLRASFVALRYAQRLELGDPAALVSDVITTLEGLPLDRQVEFAPYIAKTLRPGARAEFLTSEYWTTFKSHPHEMEISDAIARAEASLRDVSLEPLRTHHDPSVRLRYLIETIGDE